MCFLCGCVGCDMWFSGLEVYIMCSCEWVHGVLFGAVHLCVNIL